MSRRKRWARGLAVTAVALGIAAAATVAIAAPALAAVVCPGCYGLVRTPAGVMVEATVPIERRGEIERLIASAEPPVRAFFGDIVRRPYVIACTTDACDKSLGGRGARAVTYSSLGFSVVRLSPRGIDRTIVTHELSHVQVHAIIGLINLLRGAVPAWFDEGLAVLVSDDARYVKTGQTAAERCKEPASANLPASPFEWAPQSGKNPLMYANAACTVAHWLEANGGKSGVLTALDAVANGHRRLP